MSNSDNNNQSKMLKIKDKGLVRTIIDKILSIFKKEKTKNVDETIVETDSPAYTWSPLSTEVIEKEYLPVADYDEIEEDDYFSNENMITNKESYDIVMSKLSSGELKIGDLSIPDALRINSMLETELELKVEKLGVQVDSIDILNANDNENE